MSSVVNVDGIRAGCIYRISLQNFVTYKEVTLYPGKSLNIIIGPNGTGKSTFVSAIILGLAGNISSIGRGKKIAEYVKTGCQKAAIEIELYTKSKQKNVIITRNFDLKNISTWYIDNKQVGVDVVQKLIADLHIQVDNLCQILPQERVHDFSQKNPQERLHDTLANVGPERSLEQLEKLKSIRSDQEKLALNLEKNNKELKELERRNNSLKSKIDAMNERKEIKKELQICEWKKLWIEYQKLEEKVKEYQKDKKKTENSKTNLERTMVPLQREVENAKRDINGFEKKSQDVSTTIRALRDQIAKTIDSVKDQQYKLNDIESSYKRKLERHKNRAKELTEARAKLDKLNMDAKAQEERLGKISKLREELNKLQKKIAVTNASLETEKTSKLKIQYDIDNNIAPHIRHYENRIRNLRNVNEERLKMLRNYGKEDTYKAVTWLRENRHLFQQPVYEPMMLEINFVEQKFARYLEARVALRDLIAFTFESTADMNLFLHHVRTSLNLKQVNAVCSRGTPQTSNDISHLRYLGFYTYMIDTITGPDAILTYLCTHYALHRIPIGDQHTYRNSDKVPDNITMFFTENHNFSVRVSKYSGAKSSSTRELRPAKFLANSVDIEEINNATRQLNEYRQNEESKHAQLQTVNQRLAIVEDEHKNVTDKRKIIDESIQKILATHRQIKMQSEKIKGIEIEYQFDERAEMAARNNERVHCVKKQRAHHQELYGIVKGLQKKIMIKELFLVKLEISRSGIGEKDSELREHLNNKKEVEERLQKINVQLSNVASSAKEKKMEIKLSCGNKLPREPGFPHQSIFDALPSSLDEIEARCCELRTRIGIMGEGDEQIIKEYEEQDKRIQKLTQELCRSEDYKRELEVKLDRTKSKWLPPLQKLIGSINRSFGDMFARLNCAGEVQLLKEGDENDFDKYGIDIRVKFRAEEALSQLTRYKQSGGERVLTTAVFLMALQALTSDVPFRCVDEINQGMDAVNERRMLEMLAQLTTERAASQYFLLTPKLLPNLKYNERVTIHTIMNGKHIMKYNDWQYKKFLEKARLYRPS